MSKMTTGLDLTKGALRSRELRKVGGCVTAVAIHRLRRDQGWKLPTECDGGVIGLFRAHAEGFVSPQIIRHSVTPTGQIRSATA